MILLPFIFFMRIEVLRILVSKAMTGGFIVGYTFRGGEGVDLCISRLLFADDTIVFCGAT